MAVEGKGGHPGGGEEGLPSLVCRLPANRPNPTSGLPRGLATDHPVPLLSPSLSRRPLLLLGMSNMDLVPHRPPLKRSPPTTPRLGVEGSLLS